MIIGYLDPWGKGPCTQIRIYFGANAYTNLGTWTLRSRCLGYIIYG